MLGMHSLFTVTFHLKGSQLLTFIRYCKREQLLLMNITFIERHEIKATTTLLGYREIQRLAAQFNLEMTIVNQSALLHFFNILFNRKEKLLAFVTSLLFLLYLSNIVWNVSITGVTTTLEREINSELNEMGLFRGALLMKQLNADELEQYLLQSLPQLLYINVKKRGTIYTIDAKEKIKERPNEKQVPANVIATKHGMIEKMLVKEGVPVVQVYDVVRKGDLLISGDLHLLRDDQERQEDDEQLPAKLTNADGKVFANTWYQLEVTANVQPMREQLIGDYVTHYYLQVYNVRIPLFNLQRIPYDHTFITYEDFPVTLFNKKWPITFIHKKIYDKEIVAIKMAEEESKKRAIQFALTDLKHKLGIDAEIKKYFILQESVDNGKVKLKLYVTVIENIGKQVPLAVLE